MKVISQLVTLACVLVLSACSSTENLAYQDYQKPLTNDTELLISLLKRPTTADQIMMAQFEQTRNEALGRQNVGYVMITGERDNKAPATERAKHRLDWLYDHYSRQYNTQFVSLTGGASSTKSTKL
ncbi:hypothetical protein DXX93_13945 [Thalassotalea euphylliae]|uniref:Uncharacterized protein n=1 Tax=Thalassotalea euphylliae TaxID=1655234 RepID=A0A3E0TUB7_9GAMM|nr:hypothetical protein [Thalassotalea euphylliae]REL27552.1 hypothetical protein DXX93_13945 [Thalassotalea euphylliae]